MEVLFKLILITSTFTLNSNTVSAVTKAVPTEAELSLWGIEVDGEGQLDITASTRVDCNQSIISAASHSACGASGTGAIVSGAYSYPELRVLNQIAPNRAGDGGNEDVVDRCAIRLADQFHIVERNAVRPCGRFGDVERAFKDGARVRQGERQLAKRTHRFERHR